MVKQPFRVTLKASGVSENTSEPALLLGYLHPEFTQKTTNNSMIFLSIVILSGTFPML